MARNIFAVAIAAAALAFVVSACGPDGAERAGEDVDSAFENATQGHENLSDGPMENAGEALDDAANDVNAAADRVADDVEDVTNNDNTP